MHLLTNITDVKEVQKLFQSLDHLWHRDKDLETSQKAETKSVHLRVCQLTSAHDETTGEVWDKVIQQTTGNNNLSSFPC